MRGPELAQADARLRNHEVSAVARAAEIAGASMRKRNGYDKNKRDGKSALALPHCVLDSAAYLATSAYARALLVDIARAYNGFNNGRLSCTWREMQPRGWHSKDTLTKAKTELLSLGLIQETRKGRLPNTCALYALTWCALDDGKGRYDAADSAFRRGAYLQFAKNGNTVLVPPRGPQGPTTRANEPTAPQPLGPPHGPVGAKKAHSLARVVGTLIDLPGGTALPSRSGGVHVPGTVVSAGAITMPSARVMIAMLAAGWAQPVSLPCSPSREPGTEPSRQPETPDTESVELVYEPDAELVPNYDESQDDYEARQA